jgi:D-alanyl-D-alanine carboxypeptidase
MKLRRYFFFFLVFFISTFSFQNTFSEPLKSAIVVDANTRDVLYCHNADKTTQPASMAKIMSFYIAFKALKQGKIKQNSLITVSKYAVSQEPCKLGLKAGSTISVRDAILGMMTKSANDASVALAEHIAGSEENFVKMMNQEAKRLGMNSTVFFNASGWKNSKQLTSARDMAKLSLAVMKDFPQYYHLFSTKQFHYKGKRYANHNKMLGEKGDIKIDGLKTGFLCASGFNIAVSAKKGTVRLIVVVCGGKTPQKRNQRVEWLLSLAFNKLAKKRCVYHKKTYTTKTNIKENNVYTKVFPKHSTLEKKDKTQSNIIPEASASGRLTDTAESEITEQEAQMVNIEKFEKM